MFWCAVYNSHTSTFKVSAQPWSQRPTDRQRLGQRSLGLSVSALPDMPDEGPARPRASRDPPCFSWTRHIQYRVRKTGESGASPGSPSHAGAGLFLSPRPFGRREGWQTRAWRRVATQARSIPISRRRPCRPAQTRACTPCTPSQSQRPRPGLPQLTAQPLHLHKGATSRG